MRGLKASIIIVFLLTVLCSIAYPAEIKYFVNDNAGVIDQSYKANIESVLRSLYDSGTAQFAVVTVNSLEGKDIESYSIELAQGVLGDKEKNNGLLLLVAVDDRKYRFEVGRGLEAELNDAKVGRIGRNYIVDNFKNGDYGKGIYEASLAVKSILMEDTNSSYYVSQADVDRNNSIGTWFTFFIFFMIIMSILGSIGSRSTTYRKRDRFFDAALMAGLMLGGRGRGGMGGFGGGGFGGFGGGGFGGGGAGGSF